MRVAVVGAGSAGTVCGCLLKRSGCNVDLFDRAQRPGGRASSRLAEGLFSFDHGAQFMPFTIDDPGLQLILNTLPGFEGKLLPMSKEFGLVGPKGGFVSAQQVGSNVDDVISITGRDFFGAMKLKGGYMYTGHPTMGSIWSTMCEQSDLGVKGNSLVSNLSKTEAGWAVHGSNSLLGEGYDAVVLAVHDTVCVSQVLSEMTHSQDSTKDFVTPLNDLALKIGGIQRSPLYSMMVAYHNKDIEDVSFNSAVVDGCESIQWISKNQFQNSEDFSCWTAIATADFSKTTFENESLGDNPQTKMLADFEKCLKLKVKPVYCKTQRWSQAVTSNPLALNEHCLSFEPWRLAVAGDYIGKNANLESAVLSGIQAADRVLQWEHGV